MSTKWLKTPIMAVVVSLSLLLIPLIAMQFTNEVLWTASDFIILGILLSFVGLGVSAAWRFGKKNYARVLYVAAILFLFLLIWAELAVGVFNSPLAGS